MNAEKQSSDSQAMSDLPKRLRIKASMIALGERIAWGSDTAIMEEAAEVIESLSASIENHQLHMLGMARDRDRLRDMLSEQQQASAAQSAPAGEREAEAAAIAEEIDWLIRQWDAKASWSGERMAELLEAAGKASEMLASWQRTQSAGVPDGWRRAVYHAEECLTGCLTSPDIVRSLDAETVRKIIADLQATRFAMLAAAPAQPAAPEQGEVQRLREALEEIRHASMNGPVSESNAGCIKRIEQIAERALAASTAQQGEGEKS